MKYLGWAVFYEGKSDAFYLDVLIPKILRDVIANSNGGDIVEVPDQPSAKLGANGRDVNSVAKEACEFSDAFELLFIHSDKGGRGLQKTLDARSKAYCEAIEKECGIPHTQCVCITPKHETEAWILADPNAVLDSVGIVGEPTDFDLPSAPKEAEKLKDPKSAFQNALDKMNVRPRSRASSFLFPAIANRQNLQEVYRMSEIRALRDQVQASLTSLGFVA